MNDFLIQSYIERISKNDISEFSKKQGITLSKEELDIIYQYLTEYWRTFYYGNPKHLLDELKNKLSENTYSKIEALYIQAKERFN